MDGYYLNMLTGQMGLTGLNMPGVRNQMFGDSGLLQSTGALSAYAGFANAIRRASQSAQKFQEGEDVVMGFPPVLSTHYEVDAGKPAGDMTLEEYKRYICNKISDLPVSASARMNCHGTLILKEEAFVSMQKDPAYEKQVLQMLSEGFQVQYPFYAPNIGYQVIGGSAEECYGEALPMGSSSSGRSGQEKSWWERRHEKAEAYLDTGRAESLAERLEANRVSRLQARLADRRSV